MKKFLLAFLLVAVTALGQGIHAPNGGDLTIDYGTGFGNQFSLANVGTDQTANIDAADHWELTEIAANGDITISTGAGQLSGLITLPAGGKFFLVAEFAGDFSNSSGSVAWQWRNNTAASLIGTTPIAEPRTNNTSEVNARSAVAYLETSASTEVEVRIISETNLTTIFDEAYITIIDLSS